LKKNFAVPGRLHLVGAQHAAPFDSGCLAMPDFPDRSTIEQGAVGSLKFLKKDGL
jgi:hypothetical protein